MPHEIPYMYRVLALVMLMSAVAAYDYYRNGLKSTKWREYSFIIGAGLIGPWFLTVKMDFRFVPPRYMHK
ncbi:MAG: hypothetical protein ACYS4W_07835 [Planctomycetota bacterium]|jgi:hypothetical protein